jgi:hypothetical protein
MKFQIIIFLLSILSGSSLFAQTKKIAFKSHSGSEEDFKWALDENFFDLDNSNFGIGPERSVAHAELDSVIFVSDSVAVMFTSLYCKNFRQPKPKQELWQPGTDTVYYHPLFSHQHSLDSIKIVLKHQYYFQNPIDKVKFIGYDNKKDSCESYPDAYLFSIPAEISDHNSSKLSSSNISVIFIMITVFSLLAGFLSWKLKKLSYALPIK